MWLPREEGEVQVAAQPHPSEHGFVDADDRSWAEIPLPQGVDLGDPVEDDLRLWRILEWQLEVALPGAEAGEGHDMSEAVVHIERTVLIGLGPQLVLADRLVLAHDEMDSQEDMEFRQGKGGEVALLALSRRVHALDGRRHVADGEERVEEVDDAEVGRILAELHPPSTAHPTSRWTLLPGVLPLIADG